MQVALISDIHGNAVALNAILADLEGSGIDRIVCLGDVVVSGPQPREALARLQDTGCPVVMGNTDLWALDPQPHPYRDEDSAKITDIEMWGAAQLTAQDKTYLRSFQPVVEIPMGNGDTLLCFHGSPYSNTDIILPTTSDERLDPLLSGYEAQVMAGGHTHQQMLRRFKDKIFVNPGSTGLPYEVVSQTGKVRNPPWAEYGVIHWEGTLTSVELRRVPYDTGEIARIALKSHMPHKAWWTADWV
ncbi:MAG: metallophosphoesterase family protein [Chloroflexi bacterium]|nr:metallophosphoesterase family protein [Chloroflexota bacterium]